MTTIPFIFPIIPILIWAGGILLGGFGVAAAAGAFKDRNKNKLGILGMPAAGKTRFLSFLRNVPYKEGQTSRSPYKEFTYPLSDSKNIIIKSGVDIGGANTYRSDYNNILKESDVILYFFDIDKYLSSSDHIEYQRNCNSRFDHIYTVIKKHNDEFRKADEAFAKDKKDASLKEKLNNLKSKHLMVIASHKDKCSYTNIEMKRKFDDLVQSKSYKEMLKDVQFVNLTDSSETKNLINKIFKK